MIFQPQIVGNQQMEMVSGTINTGAQLNWVDGECYHSDYINGFASISVPRNSVFHLGVDSTQSLNENGVVLLADLGFAGRVYAAVSDFSVSE